MDVKFYGGFFLKRKYVFNLQFLYYVVSQNVYQLLCC